MKEIKIKKKKGYLKFAVLEILSHSALVVVDILDAMASGYPALKRQNKRHENLSKTISNLKEKQKFYSLLNRMKRSGLVTKNKGSKTSTWQITKNGIKMLDFIKNQTTFPKINYKVQSSDSYVIVTFDIRESEKRKREWLRKALIQMGFIRLQDSVYVGKLGLPDDFFKDLENLKLLFDVKIFSINKEGNLKDYNMINLDNLLDSNSNH